MVEILVHSILLGILVSQLRTVASGLIGLFACVTKVCAAKVLRKGVQIVIRSFGCRYSTLIIISVFEHDLEVFVAESFELQDHLLDIAELGVR